MTKNTFFPSTTTYSVLGRHCGVGLSKLFLGKHILCSGEQWESIPNESKWLKHGAETYCKAMGGEGKQQNLHFG